MKKWIIAGTLLVLLPLLVIILLFYPAITMMPLNTRVVDAENGLPIEGAQVLRIVSDVHDWNYARANVDRHQTNGDGMIKLKGELFWGYTVPLPGGYPVPNHRIAIWKEGYSAFIFSQYGGIDDIAMRTDRKDIIEAIKEIPKERRQCDQSDYPNVMFSGGEVKLHRNDE